MSAKENNKAATAVENSRTGETGVGEQSSRHNSQDTPPDSWAKRHSLSLGMPDPMTFGPSLTPVI